MRRDGFWIWVGLWLVGTVAIFGWLVDAIGDAVMELPR